MAKRRYEPKGEYVEQDGSPVDFSRLSKNELLIIEQHELQEELAQSNPAVVTLHRLQAVERQLRMAEEKKRAEEAARHAPWAAEESPVETKLRTGGVKS